MARPPGHGARTGLGEPSPNLGEVSQADAAAKMADALGRLVARKPPGWARLYENFKRGAAHRDPAVRARWIALAAALDDIDPANADALADVLPEPPPERGRPRGSPLLAAHGPAMERALTEGAANPNAAARRVLGRAATADEVAALANAWRQRVRNNRK